MNIVDYIRYRGDLSFKSDPFNEVDNLILAHLVYADFRGIVPESGEAVPLPAAREAFFRRSSRETLTADGSSLRRDLFWVTTAKPSTFTAYGIWSSSRLTWQQS